jgi:hypothetical protein
MSHWSVCSYAPVRPGLDRRDGCIGQPDGPLRDGMVDPAKNLLPICLANGSTGSIPAARHGSSGWTWIRARARPTAGRKAAPTTVILAAPANIRCSSSTSSVIWSGAPCDRATSTATMAGAVLEPVIARYRGLLKRCYFRGDAAFANPQIYEFS